MRKVARVENGVGYDENGNELGVILPGLTGGRTEAPTYGTSNNRESPHIAMDSLNDALKQWKKNEAVFDTLSIFGGEVVEEGATLEEQEQQRAIGNFAENQYAHQCAIAQRAKRCVFYAGLVEQAGLPPDCLMQPKSHWVSVVYNIEKAGGPENIKGTKITEYIFDVTVGGMKELGPPTQIDSKVTYGLMQGLYERAVRVVALIEHIEIIEGKSEQEAGYANPTTLLALED